MFCYPVNSEKIMIQDIINTIATGGAVILGVPVDKGGVTGTLYLLDETDNDYIVAFKNEKGVEKSVKIGKGMVKAILYKPEAEDNAN